MAGAPTDLFFFDEKERELVSAAFGVVEAGNAEQGAALRRHLDLLAHTADVVQKCSPLARSWRLAPMRASFSGEALLELLCRVPDYDLDLHIPTKAVLGQAYLIAKINFFKALGYSVEATGGDALLCARIEDETAEAIYSKLGEELFISIVTDPAGAKDVKARAARYLCRIWDDRLALEIADFAPLLEEVWAARNKVRPVLGTMIGTHEVFQLFREARGGHFLDHFGAADLPEEQMLAFEEFLFGLSHEEICELRDYLHARDAVALSVEEARTVLGRSKPSWAPHQEGAQALYTSYKKRRVKAHYRTITGTPGPKKTAEEYVMVAFLQREGHEPSR